MIGHSGVIAVYLVTIVVAIVGVVHFSLATNSAFFKKKATIRNKLRSQVSHFIILIWCVELTSRLGHESVVSRLSNLPPVSLSGVLAIMCLPSVIVPILIKRVIPDQNKLSDDTGKEIKR